MQLCLRCMPSTCTMVIIGASHTGRVSIAVRLLLGRVYPLAGWELSMH